MNNKKTQEQGYSCIFLFFLSLFCWRTCWAGILYTFPYRKFITHGVPPVFQALQLPCVLSCEEMNLGLHGLENCRLLSWLMSRRSRVDCDIEGLMDVRNRCAIEWLMNEKAGNRWVTDKCTYEGLLVQRCSQTICSKIRLSNAVLVLSFIYRINIDLSALLHLISWLWCINLNISMLMLQGKVQTNKINKKTFFSEAHTLMCEVLTNG